MRTIILIFILNLFNYDVSFALHNKQNFNWEDYVLKGGWYIHPTTKNHILLSIMGDKLEFDGLPVGGGNSLYYRFKRDLDQKKDCEEMETIFSVSVNLGMQNKKSAKEIIGKTIPVLLYDYEIPQQASIKYIDVCPKENTFCFETIFIEIGDKKKVSEFDFLVVEKEKFTVELFKHSDFDPNIYIGKKDFYNEWDLSHLTKLINKVKLECNKTHKTLSNL